VSITDDQKEIIRLGTVHSWVFKIVLWGAPVFGLWAVNRIVDHDTQIAVLKMQVQMLSGSGGSVSQNVNVGHAKDPAAQLASARDYLTTAEVAEKEQVSERTVTQWITEGRLDPPPVKAGKSWTIAKNVRILPQDTAECGETPKP
jgi:hypothetical protein